MKKLKSNWPLMIVLAALFALLSQGIDKAPPQAADGDIQWLSYAEGRDRGASQNKKVFLVFDADWCGYCAKMNKKTFRHPSVVAYVNRNFVPIKVDSDKEQTITEKYRVRGLPSTWFISETGDPIANRPGYISPDEMLDILKFFGTDSYQSMSFQAFVKKNK
jgi:thioredoxin-related protein